MKGITWSAVISITVVFISIFVFWMRGTPPAPVAAVTPTGTVVTGTDIRLTEVVSVAEEPAGNESFLAAADGGPHEVEDASDVPNEDFVTLLKDTSSPLPERMKAIDDMARRGGDDAFQALTAAAEARIYLNWAAVRALGDLGEAGLRERAAEFLRGKMCDPDMRVTCEAIRGYGRLLGQEAVQLVAASIEKNHNRPDGHGDIVASTAVEVLGDIASPEAVPVLSAELGRSEVLTGDLEYGSEVVRALERTGTPEARKAIAAYAEELEDRIPDDRLAGRYYETKIAEARACLDGKKREEVSHD